jgi:S-adenosylmethionine hydrolase
MIKKILLILIVGVMVLQLSSCNPIEQDPDQSMLVQATVIEIEKYGHAVLNVTTADFMAVGYELGDIVCVRLIFR